MKFLYSILTAFLIVFLFVFSTKTYAQCLICEQTGQADSYQCISNVASEHAKDSTCIAQFGNGYVLFQYSVDDCSTFSDCDGVTLPVELIDFKADTRNGSIVLDWITASEINNKGFEVQKWINNEWQSIGFVDGVGTTTVLTEYKFIDNHFPEVGENRYRLKQFDFDEAFSFSNVVVVVLDVEAKETAFSFYPNPSSGFIYIDYNQAVLLNDLTILIYDNLGKLVFQQAVFEEDTDGININSLPSGLYYLKVDHKTYKLLKI